MACVRDLGGLPTSDGDVTAFGAVVRADNVRLLTPEGWARARGYGIRTTLDLRSDSECSGDIPTPGGFEVYRVSLFDDFDSDATYRADLEARVADSDESEAYRVLYAEALERNAAMFAEALHVVAEAPGGVLMHCVAGKDRTGSLRHCCCAS
jgi:protein-tyrosine phosphatase